MEEKKMALAEDDAQRRKRVEELQQKEAERKRREHKASPAGQRAILKETREKILLIDHAAEDRAWMSASWTDSCGNMRRAGGPGILGLDSEVWLSQDLLVEDNLARVGAIRRACSRAADTVKDLLNLLREKPEAMPLDLEKYMGRIISEIPSLDSIQNEVTHPEPVKDAKPETAGGTGQGPAKA